MLDALLTASKPELLDEDGDRTLRGLLYDYFAFGRCLEAMRGRFASYADLTATQYLILVAMKNSRDEEPMGINQLAERLYLTGAFVTNEVNKLVTEGLIEKTAHPNDGRRVQLSITQVGFDQLIRLASLQRPANDAIFGILTREEFRFLAEMLGRLASHGHRALKLAEGTQAALEFESSQSNSVGQVAGHRRSRTARRNS